MREAMSGAGLDTQPSATTLDLEELVTRAWSGGIRVPHFQRDFRWGSSDVVRLFDSIVRGYPIGSLLLWVRSSPAARLRLGSLEIDAPASEAALWVVDGQQRITSLANALHPAGSRAPTFNLAYDLKRREFVAGRNGAAELVPVPVLFDLDELIQWFSGDRADAESFAEARRVARLLRQYRVPAYLVRHDDQQALTVIFDRMNSYGKRLSKAEVFSALFAGPEQGAGSRLTITGVSAEIAARTGFGRLDEDTVLAAILARRGPDPTREIRTEFDPDRRVPAEFPDEDRDSAYAEGAEALVRAVEFLQTHGEIPHVALLPYRALVVFTTRFLAHFPEPSERSLVLLRRVCWRAVIVGLGQRGSAQLSRALSRCISRGDEHGSVQRLLAATGDAAGSYTLRNFRTNAATAKIVLCSWWALRPRSPLTGEPYDAQELSSLLADQTTAALAVRRVFTDGLSVADANSAANMLFVPSAADPVDDVASYLSSQNMPVHDRAREAVLTSYCMDRRVATRLGNGDAEGFVAARDAIATANLVRFISRMGEWGYEDTPPLATLDLDDDTELVDDAD
jgi:Protein of unknown function DUF262